MTKAHLKSSEEPLKAGEDHVALCGETVHKAEFVMFVDVLRAGFCQVNSFHFCRNCWVERTSGRYLYGFVAGQESKDAVDDVL